MRETNALYKRLLADPSHVKENRLTIGGEIYDESKIVNLSTNEALFAEDKLSIGGAVAREISFSAFLSDSVPKRAKIIHEVRLRLGDEVSEWLQKGVYYIDTRSRDPLTGVTTVHGFDAILMAEQEWIPPAKDKFPMDMQEAVELTAAALKLTIDPRSTFKTGDAYMVDYPVADADESEEQQAQGLSIRQMWRWVAAAHGGNFIINDLGQLRLVPLNALPAETGYLVNESGNPITFGGVRILLSAGATGGEVGTDKVFVGNQAAQAEEIPALDPIGKVILKVDDNNAYVSKSDTGGLTLEVDCAYGSQQMADDLLAQLQGYVYRPVQAEDALIDPAAELGDGVTINGVYTILAQKDTLWDLLAAADIGAPGEAELESEFRFTSAEEMKYQYQLAQTRSLISKNSGSIELLVEKTGELGKQYSSIGLRLDSISLTVYGKAATETEEAVLGLTGRMTSAEASIKLNADNLSLTVKKGSIISAINQSAETIKISAGKINLDGYVTFSALKDGPDEDNGQTFINGGWIDTENMTVKNAVNAQKLSGEEIALMNGTEQFGTITMKSSETYALDISSKTSLRLQSGYGFNTFIGYNEGPHLLLTGSPLIPGAMKCKLQGGALVIGTKSYGTDDPPVTGNEEAGQVYFKLLS